VSLAGLVRRVRGVRFVARPRHDGVRELVTPEGVDLALKVGSYGERFGAFVIDFGIILGALLGFTLLLALGAWATKATFGSELLGVIWVLGAFLLRNFYFVGFEVRTRAATPGKRLMGLRVAAADGGRLTADAIFARNAMRELEVFLPMTFLAASGQGIDAVLIGLGAVWSAVFVLFPLFNRDRRRMGDLVAGTVVLKTPQRRLAPDLADRGAAAAAELGFTPAQLDAYGVRELHVLEDILRSGSRKAVAEVAERIKAKIGWAGLADVADRTFLSAYYAGLRARLEGQLLFGRRRKDKFDRI
jgi:uncharacterized RDD family membrane protein YckC